MSFRKLLLTTLFFAASWVIALSQSVVTLHGMVTNNEGDPQEDIIIIATAYFVDSTVVSLTLETDANGEYAGSIDTPGPNIYGWLEVSMVDCWGTTITRNFEIIEGNEDFAADFIYCEEFPMDSCLVLILEEWHPGNELELVAWNPLGQEAEYNWSTGETTQSIFPQETGTYCVTALFPSGCAWTDCIDVFVDSNDVCFVFIVPTLDEDSLWTLEAHHSSDGPVEYVWSTGETTQSITDLGPGTYCVTASDNEGCTQSACMILEDFGFCEVYIWENPNGGLMAEGFGEPPVTYVWNTGETTQTIFPSQNGLYCVTVTDASGCEAESCYDYFHSQDSCFVYIEAFTLDSNTLALQAFGFTGAETWLYTWSTGETTEIIYPTDPNETYCVTLTDSDGCESSACFDFGNFCYSWVNVDYIDTLTANLSVWLDPIFDMEGAPEPSYLWSDGSTDSELTVYESGEYCVTITIGSNCITEACGYVDFDSLGVDCSVWVYTYIDSSGNWVAEAAPWGFGEFEYEWTNGETTSTIALDNPTEFACVTVTSSFGCEAVACNDSIMDLCGGVIDVSYQNDIAILTANVWNYDDEYELVWSTGELGHMIEVTEEGNYCVVMTSENCAYTICADVYFWNTDSCGVWISYDFDPGGVLYTAEPWGTPPFTYLWSNGDTSPSVLIDFGDPDVCVTVTDATGCAASACTFPIDSCDIIIHYVEQPEPTLVLESIDPIQSVLWSTGDTTETLVVPGPGTYCADVTTVSGCVASVCYTIDSMPDGLQDFIEGVVFVDSLEHAEGWVIFYTFNPNSGEIFTAVDSAQIAPTGHYASGPLPDGLYLAKAIMTPGTNAAEDYLPTYHYSGTSWLEAAPIGIPGEAYSHDVFMIPAEEGLSGGGVIAGVILAEQGLVANEEISRGGPDGLADIEIILKDAQGIPLKYTWSLEDGAYSFEGLPYGTYRISFDIPGLTSPEIWVTLTPDMPERLQVNITVEGGSTAVHELITEEVSLYPNPANLEVMIPMPGAVTQYEMQLVDMQGKIVKAGSVSNENGVITIDVRAYAPGLYHINLSHDRNIYYGRFIKQD